MNLGNYNGLIKSDNKIDERDTTGKSTVNI